MVAGQKNTHLLFGKLNRQLTKLAGKPSAKSVHGFRTSGRRMEVLLDEFASDAGRSGKKLLKMLSRLRKRAGRVRDLDVQTALLRSLKMPEGARHKSQLLQTLVEERFRREKKIAEAFDKQTVRELRKRLKRAESALQIQEKEAWRRVQRTLAQIERQSEPLTEKMLHRYRIFGKRARYLAELESRNPEAKRAVHQLKDLQNALGDWHDWLKLTQRAEDIFSAAPGSPLVAALRNLTRAKFRDAAAALTETRAVLVGKKHTAAEDVAARKDSAAVPTASAAA